MHPNVAQVNSVNRDTEEKKESFGNFRNRLYHSEGDAIQQFVRR